MKIQCGGFSCSGRDLCRVQDWLTFTSKSSTYWCCDAVTFLYVERLSDPITGIQCGVISCSNSTCSPASLCFSGSGCAYVERFPVFYSYVDRLPVCRA